MSRLPFVAGLLVCSLWLVPRGAAQERAGVRSPALEALRPEARARVAWTDTLLAFRTRRIMGGRLDVKAGVLRAAYRIDARLEQTASPQAAARAYLVRAAADFGWDEAAEDLALIQVVEGPFGSHVLFQQTFRGLPVYNRFVKVSLRRDGQPAMALSGYAVPLARTAAFDLQPRLSAAEAAERARTLVASGASRTSDPELFIYPDAPPRLVWRLLAWPEGVAAEWEVLLDAHTGDLVQLFDQSTHARATGGPAERSATTAPRSAAPRGPAPAVASPGGTRVNGRGFVFDPDPLTTSGRAYSPPYVDQDDADLPELNAERREVDLLDITRSPDGRYRLEGPYVQIVGENVGDVPYTPPAELDPGAFRYTRANDFFEAVMAYYHIDTSQRYVQALAIGRGIQNGPIRVNPRGLLSDDSKYYPGANAIVFGTGGIDDAEDADVIWHEYGHALLEGSAPGLRNTFEGRALHEGWADYWAASYSRGLVETGRVPPGAWERLYTWDGNNECWQGRTLDHQGHYPDDMAVAPPAGCAAQPTIYQWGLLWATTLMAIYDDLGRTVTDRLTLASHGFLIPSDRVFEDAAEALIEADLQLYDGAHVGVLLEHLGASGFIDPGAWGPVVKHEPLLGTEQLGGMLPVDAEARGTVAAIDSVLLFHGLDGVPGERLVLRAAGNDRFEGALPLPSQSDTVRYYLEAVDVGGRRTRLPLRAPLETFQFTVGPDAEPPQIKHNPITRAVLVAGPVEVVATVGDNIGVDSVWVDYVVSAPGGAQIADGAFGMNGADTLYSGVFPIEQTLLEEGSRVAYRIRARDAARQANEAVLPEAGWFTFEVFAEGALVVYDFEGTSAGLQATGTWRRGAPAYGVRVAHSGSHVWATAPDAAYAATPGHESLILPGRNLTAVGPAYLIFWHWYDMEHDGRAEPGRTDAVLWDGGNVKVSTDGGHTWSLLGPEGGYSGLISSNTVNPMEGEAAFGGYSYGWRREIMPLPAAEDVRVRFDFGSDDGNVVHSVAYAGWYLDDVTITTLRPEDATPPSASALPPALVVRDVGMAPPPVQVQLEDDTGVASVLAEYAAYDEADRVVDQGILRLQMDPADLTRFAGTFRLTAPLEAGSRLEYRLRVTDFDGNEAVFPEPSTMPFRVEYVRTKEAEVLRQVQASGLWQRQGETWRLGAGGARPSSLVFEPFDLPTNAQTLTFVLAHQYDLAEGLAGNVKLSLDDGRTWAVLDPEAGYQGVVARGTSHPLAGEAAFVGASGGSTTSTFDLAPYAGQQVRLRVDFGAVGVVEAPGAWTIERARLAFATQEPAFETPRELRLHANFPDPFSSATNIGYTLPSALPVRLEVFDLVGRRVALLVDAVQPEGTYMVPFDATGLASGVYVLRMTAGGAQHVEQMVVAR